MFMIQLRKAKGFFEAKEIFVYDLLLNKRKNSILNNPFSFLTIENVH